MPAPRRITLFGETKTTMEWSKDPRCPVSYEILNSRLKAGKNIEWSIITPHQKSGTKEVKVGDIFERLIVKSIQMKPHQCQNALYATVKCSCPEGKIWDVLVRNLLDKTTKSCGCYKSEIKSIECSERNYKHGQSINGNKLFVTWCNQKFKYDFCKEWLDYIIFEKWALENGYTKECHIKRIDEEKPFSPQNCYIIDKNYSNTRIYNIWNGMLLRCNWVKFPQYCNYGGKGVKICNEWKNFINFYNWSIKNNYDDSLTIDRIDSNWHYCPENCRWATNKQQAESKHNNRTILAWNEVKSLLHWTKDERCKADIDIIKYRLWELGWGPEQSISTVQYQG